jgi:membrane-associated phospholipid phosphatase
MDALLASGIALIRDLQLNTPHSITALFSLFTSLGEENFFLLFMPILYWAVDPVIGLRVGVLLLTNTGLNSVFKMALHGPRPFWLDPQVKALRLETTFGIPSGHAQIATGVWGGLAASLRRKWSWVVAIFLILIIGVSRVFLGVHFPTDVLAGWLLGGILLWIVLGLEKPAVVWFNKHSLRAGILAIFLFTLGLVFLGLLSRLSLSAWSLPAEWISNANQAYPDLKSGEMAINPLVGSEIMTATGTLFGMAAGFLFLYRRGGGFKPARNWWKRVVCLVLGLFGLLIIWRGLGVLQPYNEDFLSYAFRYIRYGLVGSWVAVFAPLIFKRLDLTDLTRN